jgi:acetyl-CoA C-acetyltransferase
MSAAEAKASGVVPLARVLAYADSAKEPERFTTAPSLAIPKALAMAGLTIKDVDLVRVRLYVQ